MIVYGSTPELSDAVVLKNGASVFGNARRKAQTGGSMRRLLKTALAATTLAGATLFAAAPSQAGISFSFSFGVPNGVAFSHESGGYCDDWGCPDAYWDMPHLLWPRVLGWALVQRPTLLSRVAREALVLGPWRLAQRPMARPASELVERRLSRRSRAWIQFLP